MITDTAAGVADVNLHSLPTIKYAGDASGFTGTKTNGSIVSFLGAAAEAKIGGGNYYQVYSPSQFIG